MKTIIETKTVGKITIASEFIGNKQANWDTYSNIPTNYHNHLVRVSCKGKSLKFDFWGSLMKPEIISDNENIFALYCFILDSIAGEMSFKQFCDEFSYETDSIRALKTYKMCNVSAKKFTRVFGCAICELYNELQETYDL